MLGGGGEWAKNGPKWQKFGLSCSISQEPYVIWLSFIVHDNISRCYYTFLKFWFFGLLRGVKGQKMVQNDKKFCPLHSIFQEPCVIWLSPVLNDNVSMYFFHFFKILIFWFFRKVKGQKMIQNDKKFCPLHSISHKPYIIWLSFLVGICKMIISQGIFFIFSTFWFSRFIVGQLGKKWFRMTKNSVCCTPYLRNHLSYDCHLWCKCVKW